MADTDNKEEIDHPFHQGVNKSVGKSAGLNEQHAMRRLVAATAVGHSDTCLSPQSARSAWLLWGDVIAHELADLGVRPVPISHAA